VEAARRRIAGVIDRVGHAAVRLERGLGAPGSEASCIFGRRDAEIALEQPLEMVRRVTDRVRDLRQRRRLLGGLDELDCTGDGFTVTPDLIRLTAQAGAESSG